MSLCGTTISYNGIIIEDPLTSSWDFQPVYDGFGEVDIIGIRVRLTFVASLHVASSWCRGVQVWTPYGGGTSGLAPGLRAMCDAFLMPRKRFTMTIGNQTQFDVRPWATDKCDTTQSTHDAWIDVDIQNGPRTTMRILAVQGTHAVKAELSIEFVKAIKCPSNALKDFVNCRWVVDEDIDPPAGWIRTRTYRGKFRVKGIDASITGINPHDIVRDIAVPPKQRGFQRQHFAYSQSNNGLEMDFTIVDKEVPSQAPAPADDWDGDFNLSFPNGEIVTESSLSFWLQGSCELPRAELFKLAYRIVESKLAYKARNVLENRNGDAFVVSAEFGESLKNNRVSVRVIAKNFDKDAYLMNLRMNGNNQSLNMLGVELPADINDGTQWNQPPHDPKWQFRAPDSYNDLTGIYLCALQNPCCPEEMPNAGTGSPQQSYDAGQYSQSAGQLMSPIRDYDRYSKEHVERMYQWYKLSSHYHDDTGWRGTARGVQCVTSGGSTPQATVAFSQIHCGVGRRHVRIHAARVNAWPQMPRKEHWRDRNGILHVLEAMRLEPQPPSFSADALSVLYEVYADYEYILERPPDLSSYANESIIAGVLPYTTNAVVTKAMSAMTKADFVDPKQILDPETSN